MLNKQTTVGVAGASGYGGAELLRVLHDHPAFEVGVVAGGTTAGLPLSEVFPHLRDDTPLVASLPGSFDGCGLVFLATPHELSASLAPALVDAGIRVVDLSAAFRLDSSTFEQWYEMPHPAPGSTPAVYGLPELFADDIPAAQLVANPGCYPTAALLALLPLRDLVVPESLHIAGLSGTSGAGKGLRDDLHVTHASNNVAAYGAPSHRHTPEIEQAWNRLTGARSAVTFTPHLVPMPRGLLCTVTADLLADVDADQVRQAAEKAYQDSPFVTVVAAGRWPSTTHLRGSNGAALGVAVDPRTRRVTASCAIDNLGKGAAGQAVQNANLMFGLPQDAGLSAVGVYP
ncbi:MAG: N-acetyl-gamma-glutamyl-phosphate reductase [Nitriliruptorales bacterium]|nr:N-acetyl-gamma-glutamyl-phosphate reductase [Nitriliruptorales bacterium]